MSSKQYKLQNCWDFFFLSSSIWYHLFVSNVEWILFFFFFNLMWFNIFFCWYDKWQSFLLLNKRFKIRPNAEKTHKIQIIHKLILFIKTQQIWNPSRPSYQTQKNRQSSWTSQHMHGLSWSYHWVDEVWFKAKPWNNNFGGW